MIYSNVRSMRRPSRRRTDNSSATSFAFDKKPQSRIKTVSSVLNDCPKVFWNPEHVIMSDSSTVSVLKFYRDENHEEVVIRVVIGDGPRSSAVYWDIVPGDTEDEYSQIRGRVVQFVSSILRTTPSSKTNRAYGVQALLMWLSNINSRRNQALYPDFDLHMIANPAFVKVDELIDEQQLLSESHSPTEKLNKILNVRRFESYVASSSPTVTEEVLVHHLGSNGYVVACGIFDDRSHVPALHKKVFDNESEARHYAGQLISGMNKGLAQLVYCLCRTGGFRGFSPSF